MFKRDLWLSVDALRVDARRAREEQEAAQQAQEMAWERRHEEVLQAQREATQTAAAAARDEARRQGETTRLHNWMMTDPIGQAWRKATAPGRADAALADRVRAKNLAWRQAWTRQCAADGLAPVAPAKVRGGWVRGFLTGLGYLLVALGVVLFAANTVGWLVNHSWFTPELVNDADRSTSFKVPKRGTREFLTPALAVWAYVSVGLAALALVGGWLFGQRHGLAVAHARVKAIARNAALEAERAQHYGFDPLAATVPAGAHWAVLGDGSDPEAAVVTMKVQDPSERRRLEYMGMSHVNRMRAIADWGGRARPDTPEVLPPGMVAELERMRVSGP